MPEYDALLREAESTQREAYRPGTRHAHRRAIKLFVGFSVYYSEPYLDPHIYHVLAFIQYLAKYMASPLSVKNVMGALTTAYRRAGWDHTPFTSHAVHTALRSLEINSRYMPTPKRAITPHELSRIIHYVHAVLKDSTLICALTFGYVGMFRQSNLAAATSAGFDHTRQFTRGDITPTHDGLLVTLKWSKTIQAYRDATTVFLPRIPASVLCPVRAHSAMLLDRPTMAPNDPLLVFPDRRHMPLSYLNRQWRRALKHTGLNREQLSLHSLRRGGATMVWQTGLVAETDLMTHGTWASSAWRAYASKPPGESSVAMAFKSLANYS